MILRSQRAFNDHEEVWSATCMDWGWSLVGTTTATGNTSWKLFTGIPAEDRYGLFAEADTLGDAIGIVAETMASGVFLQVVPETADLYDLTPSQRKAFGVIRNNTDLGFRAAIDAAARTHPHGNQADRPVLKLEDDTPWKPASFLMADGEWRRGGPWPTNGLAGYTEGKKWEAADAAWKIESE